MPADKNKAWVESLLREMREARSEGCGVTVHYGDDLDLVIAALEAVLIIKERS